MDHQQLLLPLCRHSSGFNSSTHGRSEFLSLWCYRLIEGLSGSVVLGIVMPLPFSVVHGHVRPHLHPLLRPLLRVRVSVRQPNSTFAVHKRKIKQVSEFIDQQTDSKRYYHL
jgi:hypothetical protein